MTCNILKCCTFTILISIVVLSSALSFSQKELSLIEVTPRIREYAISTVKPVLDSYAKRDKLSLLLKTSDILIDSELGIHANEIEPSTFIIYDKLEKLKLGFLITFRLSSEQKKILREWHSKFMPKNPANVFFAPSADDIIKTKAAFGCSHYARAFIAVVKALGLIDKPEDLLPPIKNGPICSIWVDPPRSCMFWGIGREFNGEQTHPRFVGGRNGRSP